MTGVSIGSGPAGTTSERTCSRCSSEPSRSARPQAYRTAVSAWGLKSVGARILRIAITRRPLLHLSAGRADQGVEALEEVSRDRPRPPRADGAAVAFDH